MKASGIFLFASILLASCAKDASIPDTKTFPFPTPTGFPEPILPANNPLTEAKIALGKTLFYDPILSRDSSISCNSCHQQEHAFSDAQNISIGIDGRLGIRNVQPLFNLAWNPSYFRDGGVTTLELVPLNAITSHVEMDMDMQGIIKRVNRHPMYEQLFRTAFNDTATVNGMLHALACFQRILISAGSPYDQFQYQGKEDAVSESAKRGGILFFSNKTDCSQCHSGFNYTNYSFQSNHISEIVADTGRQRITLLPEDRGKFQVPSIRNAAYSFPYMHDGSLHSLEEVIAHYNSGGQNFPGKNPLIRPLGLTEQEKSDLLEFIKSLSDQQFLSNPEFHQNK